jgi:hypothetical protein
MWSTLLWSKLTVFFAAEPTKLSRPRTQKIDRSIPILDFDQSFLARLLGHPTARRKSSRSLVRAGMISRISALSAHSRTPTLELAPPEHR